MTLNKLGSNQAQCGDTTGNSDCSGSSRVKQMYGGKKHCTSRIGTKDLLEGIEIWAASEKSVLLPTVSQRFVNHQLVLGVEMQDLF